ncbi:MAG: TraR/DksA family transcriptional regulator [Candidatus Tectomicrobia bacterium]|nr:TraR/DksA family transcriptional regulator [Candidatus Tectomicrobia bacterium]
MNKKSPNKKSLEKYRQKLLEIRRSFLGDVGARMRESKDLGDDGTQDIADQAAEIHIRQILIDLGEKERNQLRLVMMALEKIENNTYGICERCGGKIPAKRLDVMPYARFCVSCQSEAEQAPREG